jgi:hypothetical protein
VEHVDTGLAGIDLPSGVVDHLEKLPYRGDVDFFHLLLHHARCERGHPGERTEDHEVFHEIVSLSEEA